MANQDKKEDTKKNSAGEVAGTVGAVGLGAVIAQALKDYFLGASVPAATGKATASSIWAQQAIQKANAAQAAANRAKAGAALGAKVPAAAGLGLVGAAGLAGATAIQGTKNKFDEEVEAGIRDEMSGWDSIMKAIKEQRNNKNTTPARRLETLPKKTPYDARPLGPIKPVKKRPSSASPELIDLSKELYNRKTKDTSK